MHSFMNPILLRIPNPHARWCGGQGEKNTITYLKNNLSAHSGVAKRFKMLTYYVYAPLFHRFAPCPEH